MSGCKRRGLIEKNKEFIIFLSHLPAPHTCKIIAVLGGKYINTISEIFQNFLKKNLTQDVNNIRRLKRYREEVRKIALRKTPIHKKKKILQSRRGGAILSVLLPLAAGLISSIFK